MSILSTTNSGKIQSIRSYFKENYPEMKIDISLEKSGEYITTMRPMDIYGSISIDLDKIPCNITFENMPNIYIKNANDKTLKKLGFRWIRKCTSYKFVNTTFRENDIDFVKNNHTKIINSTIYITDNNEIDNDLIENLICEAVLQSNTIMIKYKDETKYKLLDKDEWILRKTQ